MSLLALLPSLIGVGQSLFHGSSSCSFCARDGKFECDQGCPNGRGGDGCCIEPQTPATVAAASPGVPVGAAPSLDEIERFLTSSGLGDLFTVPTSARSGAGNAALSGSTESPAASAGVVPIDTSGPSEPALAIPTGGILMSSAMTGGVSVRTLMTAAAIVATVVVIVVLLARRRRT